MTLVRARQVLLAVACLAAVAARAAAADDRPPVIHVALDDVPAGAAGAVLERAGTLPFTAAIRIIATTPEPDPALEARIAEASRKQRPVWLALPAPASAEAVDRWRLALRRLLDRHGDALTILEILADDQPARVAIYAIQNAASEVGERRDRIRVAIGGALVADPSRRGSVATTELVPYVDLIAIPDERVIEVTAWLRTAQMPTRLAVTPATTGAAPASPSLLDGVISDLAAERPVRAWDAQLPIESLKVLAALGSLLEHETAALDDAGVQLALTESGRDVTAAIPHWLLFDPETFATFLAYRGSTAPGPLSVALNLPVEGTPAILDLVTGARAPVGGYEREAATSRVRAALPLTGHTMLVAFNEGATPIADRSTVSAVRALTVGEIIARHQQQQRAQDVLLKNYVAKVRMEQHFRPTVADPGYDVVTENRYFSAPDGIEWEELSFSVNGAKWGEDRPPFPMLQPEKVLALPLELRFDEGYRYRLLGSERVDDYDCYAVRFEPVREDSALYTGTVWIDKRTFARVRVKASQGGLSAPVVSNEEDQHFSVALTIGNRPVFLFTSLTARQIMLLAGRNLLVEKRVEFSEFRVNDDEFERARDSARESRHVMFRETAGGLRYYMVEDGRRVVSERPTVDLRAIAMGVTLDPSYAFPLPILGIDYLDFQFGNPNTQLAILFAGVLAAGNIQRSHLWAKNVDASVDFFAIGVPSSDRVFENGREVDTKRLLTWPLSTGLNLGWQASSFMKATFQYQFRFDGYVRDRTTAETYTTPSSTLTNGVGGVWEYRRDGYSVIMNGTLFKRLSWRDWGEIPVATPSSYVKYSIGATRDFFLGPFQKIHLNGAWFGGRDLDRLNKYQFGMFDDTRIHGVPSSGVRFGELAMFRGAYSFNIFDQYRLDLFAEHAWGRDDPGTGDWQRVPGIGFALNVKAPWNTILRADFGKSFLPAQYGDLGSMTLQIMLLKPLR